MCIKIENFWIVNYFSYMPVFLQLRDIQTKKQNKRDKCNSFLIGL